MNTAAHYGLVLLAVYCVSTRAESWQEASSRVFTHSAIVWKIPSNSVPKELWVYRRTLPHIFPRGVISNAIVLGSLQGREFPTVTTNESYIWEEVPPNWPGAISPLFCVKAGDASFYFGQAHVKPVSEKAIPDDATIVNRARSYSVQLGLDPAQLTKNRFFSHRCDTSEATNVLCGRGVFFPRYLDGIAFFSIEENGENAEGFSMEFGEQGKIQSFSVHWSEMKRYRHEQTASPSEILNCIRRHQAIILPEFNEGDFDRLGRLSTAKQLTIIRITLYYLEGTFGEMPVSDVPCKYATPFAELDAIANFGNSDTPVHLLAPILSSEIKRLLP